MTQTGMEARLQIRSSRTWAIPFAEPIKYKAEMLITGNNNNNPARKLSRVCDNHSINATNRPLIAAFKSIMIVTPFIRIEK